MIVGLVQLVVSYKTLIFGSFDLPWIRPNVANSETMLTKNQAECIFSFPCHVNWVIQVNCGFSPPHRHALSTAGGWHFCSPTHRDARGYQFPVFHFLMESASRGFNLWDIVDIRKQ